MARASCRPWLVSGTPLSPICIFLNYFLGSALISFESFSFSLPLLLLNSALGGGGPHGFPLGDTRDLEIEIEVDGDTTHHHAHGGGGGGGHSSSEEDTDTAKKRRNKKKKKKSAHQQQQGSAKGAVAGVPAVPVDLGHPLAGLEPPSAAAAAAAGIAPEIWDLAGMLALPSPKRRLLKEGYAR